MDVLTDLSTHIMMISVDDKKASDKIQHPFSDSVKTSKQTEKENTKKLASCLMGKLEVLVKAKL
jgi:hypothetical protein